MRGFERIEKNKFVIDVTKDEKDEKHPADYDDNDAFTYSFGQKFYYDGNDKNKNMFITKKYVNLKQEIINNKIFNLNIKTYDEIYKKAQLLISCKPILQYAYFNKPDFDFTKIETENILSVLLYTDYTDLSYNFSKSFRKINDTETDETFKDRKREFYWWSKILIYTVHKFGEKTKHSGVPVYYTGISQPVIFNSLVTHFHGATSTTKQIAVATLFAKTGGLILELK
eukprot:307143_1